MLLLLYIADLTSWKSGPFKHVSRRKKLIVQALSVAFLTVAFLASSGARSAKENRNTRFGCKSEENWPGYVVLVGSTLLNIMFLQSSYNRLRPVLVPSDGNLGDKCLRSLRETNSGEIRLQHVKGALGQTATNLKQLLADVKKGSEDLMSATRFLASENGLMFLREIVEGVNRLRLLDNQVVRIDFTSSSLFITANIACSCISMFAAYKAADDCSAISIMLQFLEHLSITLLSLIAIATFAGIQDHARLICVPVQHVELTSQEKFLVSVLAANSNGFFRGFAKTSTSCYANIGEEGDVKVFEPVHMSLFAYREARTTDKTGEIRHFEQSASDCIGHYEMAGHAS